MFEDGVLGRNAYSRKRGCSPNAVSKAIRSGRIARAVIWGKGGRVEGIRWRLADQLWTQNTDPGQAQKSRKFSPRTSEPIPAVTPQTGRPGAPASAGAMLRQRKLAGLLGKIFAVSVISWAAEIVARHQLTPDRALDIVEGAFMTFNFTAAAILGIADPGDCEVMIEGELEAAQSAALRPGLLDRIRAAATEFGNLGDGPQTPQ